MFVSPVITLWGGWGRVTASLRSLTGGHTQKRGWWEGKKLGGGNEPKGRLRLTSQGRQKKGRVFHLNNYFKICILGLKLKMSSYKLQSKSKWAKLKSFGKNC